MLKWLGRVSASRFEVVFGRQEVGGGLKRPSDFSSNLVTHGSALLGIVAASAKREPSKLVACRDTSLNGVLGVECSNHSVPTIFFNDLGQCPPHWPFSCA